MTINELIGRFLQETREKKGYSLQDVSNRLGKSRYTISGYEHGRNNITAETMLELCQIYGISPNDIQYYVWRHK